MSLKPHAVIAVLVIATHNVCRAEEPQLSGVDRAFFENNVRPILVKHCYECHSSDSKDVGGGLLLDSVEALGKGGQSGAAIVPGDPKKSLLISAVNYDGLEMPPEQPLAPQDVNVLKEWVRRGAKYPRSEVKDKKPETEAKWRGESVWSFRPRTKPPVPKVNNVTWSRDPIDRFVLARIETAARAPVTDAAPRVLLRRLYFDLIGLPPTIDEISAFESEYVANPTAAMEEAVDSLLAKPQFGERWGRHWLDVARYAESNGDDGLGRNATFPHAWRYRDYVIDAFNNDVPYDRFITEQIAGDLLPAENAEERNRQLIATGFLAIGSKPAAAMNKDFAMDVVNNQINVVSTGILGLSVSCARCHDHKHDPIPTRDYYAMAGIFTNTETLYGLGGNEKLTAPPTPLHELTSTWKPNAPVKPKKADKLVLPDEYKAVVEKLKPIVHTALAAKPDKLECKGVVAFDPNNFAKVKASNIHGKLPKSGGAYSVSFWFRNQTPNNQRPITAYLFSRAKLGDAGLPGDHIGIGGKHEAARTGKLFVFNGNKDKKSLAGTTVIAPGSWNHVALSRDGDTVRVFLNGNLEIEGQLPATFGDSPDFCLANRSDKFAPLVGNLAEFALWERALTNEEAQTLHAASGRPPGPRSVGLAMGVREKKNFADCKIHIAGASAKLGPAVPRGFLTAYAAVQGPEANCEPPTIDSKNSGRRELAVWLTRPKHPQTARVMVNRIWLHLFGRGIVATPDDFGVYGARPTNPDLLDHLAERFVQDDWSMKQFIRTLVLTRTYQLDSACDEQLAASDPDNELLARHSRRRLDAESIRDSILSASGQLDLLRPKGSAIDKVVQLINWPPGEATNLHKPSNHRSVYLCMLRHSPPAELIAFDLPDGIGEAGQRPETTSPTQSLFLLNNPFVVEQSKLLAKRVLADNEDRYSQVRDIFRFILRRDPEDAEFAQAIEYIETVGSSMKSENKKTRRLKPLASLCQALFATNEFRYID